MATMLQAALKRIFFPVIFFVLSLNLTAQNPSGRQPLEIKLFEYIYERDVNNSKHFSRIVLLEQDSAKAFFTKSFVRAFAQKWNLDIKDPRLTVKPLKGWNLYPKFKTNLDLRDPAKWYLFLQVYDVNRFVYSNPTNNAASSWRIKYKLINGATDSAVAEKDFYVNFNRHNPVPGQVAIMRLPALPDEYYKAFDSVAAWTVKDSKEPVYTITLVQAMLYNPNFPRPDIVVRDLVFKNLMYQIVHQGEPAFTLNKKNVNHTKTATRRNVGGNIAGGALTLLTGIRSEKNKRKLYTADYHFTDLDQQYHCFVDYTEVESAERERIRNDDGSVSTQSSDMHVSGRYVDSSNQHYILLGGDTIARFNLKYFREQNNYTHLWNGHDSATISPIPFQWKTVFGDAEVKINGEIYGIPFTMHTTNQTRTKMFTLNNETAMTINGYGQPENGQMFVPVKEEIFKAMTILASLPYEFLNRGEDSL